VQEKNRLFLPFKGLIMNKMWVWVGFPVGIGALMLLLVLVLSDAGADVKYKTVRTPKGELKIGYIDKRPGEGEAAVKKSDAVIISVTLRAGGQTIASKKFDQDQPYKLGDPNGFGPGFDEGLIGMKVRGVRELIIPSELFPQRIKGVSPGTDLNFEVQLSEITEAMPAMPFHHGQPMPPPPGPRDPDDGDFNP
jgi:hypothetical protein